MGEKGLASSDCQKIVPAVTRRGDNTTNVRFYASFDALSVETALPLLIYC